MQLVNMILQYKNLKSRLYYKALGKLTDINFMIVPMRNQIGTDTRWYQTRTNDPNDVANVTGKDCTIGTQLSLPVPNQHYFFLLFT